jgi:tRNA nucleotidyltransferase (CCA-adding enzyme)
VVAREHGNIHRSSEFSAVAIVRLLERCDAFRKPACFEEVLLACECDARGRLGFEEAAYPQRQRLLQSLHAAQTVTADNAINNMAVQAVNTSGRSENASKNEALEAKSISGKQIGELIHAARVQAVEKLIA